MTARWLPGIVVAAGLVAAWGAARYAGCVTALLAAALVAAVAVPAEERRLISPEWVVVGLLLLAVGWSVALDHELAMRHSILLVLAAALFGLARRAGADDRLVGLLAIGIAATAVMAVAQVFAGTPPPPDALGAVAPELRTRALARLSVGRASGTAAVPGHFAALLVCVTPLLVARLARAAPWRRWPWGAWLALVAVGVVLTRSLAGVLLAAALAGAALALRRPSWRLLAAGGVALAAVATATVLLRTDLAALEPVRLRWVNWQTAGWAFATHPLLGVGFGGVGQAGLTAPTGAANITPYAHNTYLQLAAELGVAGIALAGAGSLALVRLVAAGRREHLPLALAVTAIPLHNLFDFSAYAPEVVLPWAVLAGTLAARVRPLPPRPLPARLLVPVVGGALALAAATWRAETLLTAAYAAPPARTVELALSAARWAPWTVAPVQAAAGAALEASDPRVFEIDRELASRWWVRPASAAWAEARARLLHAAHRDGEALVWAREARRRAPWRGDLAALEAMCSSTT